MVGMGDMMGMMKKAKQMQKDLENLQKELEKVEISSSMADLVTVTVSGAGNITKLELAENAMSQDKETLEDVIMAAFNEAKEKVDTHIESERSKIVGGMKLPF